MIMDKQTTLRDNVALTSVATTLSDSYDTGAGKSNLGRGRPLRAICKVGTAFTSGGSATLTVNYVQSANSDLSSPDILASSAALIPVASLVAGYTILDILLPDNTKRYVGFQEVIATAAMTAGKLTSAFVEVTDARNTYSAAV